MVRLEVTKDNFMLRVKFFSSNPKEWNSALAQIKCLKGARFNSKDKCWMVQDIPENVDKLMAMGKVEDGKVEKPKPKIPAIYSQCPDAYKDYATEPEFVPNFDIHERQKMLIADTKLNGPIIPQLRNYQIDFLRFMEARGGRALLGDDMGTGKTLQSLAWLAYKNSFPALIVVTAPTKLQWECEYNRWLKDFPNSQPVEVLRGQTPRKLYAGSTIIINWDILWYWKDVLAKYGFRCIIGDEAQAIGNPESKRARAFMGIAKHVPQCIVMSGTPARSKPAQYWTMIKCVEPDLFPQYRAYTWRYCGPSFDPFTHGVVFNGLSNAKELHYKLMKCMLRRTKQEVMTELPAKQIEVVPLEVDEAMKKAYEGEESMLNVITDKNELKLKVAALGRTAYSLKEKSLIRWVDELLEITGEKVVIFCWHRDVVDLLEQAFSKYNPAKIYGGLSLKEREAQKAKFIEDDSCKIILGNIQALGTGVDGLQKVCCKAVFAEFANTATDSAQAEDRLHRGGQENPVTIYYTCAKNTIDEDLMAALDEKRKMLDSALDGKETDDGDLLTQILARRGVIKAE